MEMLGKGQNLSDQGGWKRGGVKLFLKKRVVKLFLLDSWGGQIFFACVEAARPSSARNGECTLQAFNKYSDAI